MVDTRQSNTRQLRSRGQAPGKSLSQMKPAKKRNKPPPKKTKEPRGRKAEESSRQDEEVEDNPDDDDDERDLDNPTVDVSPDEGRLGPMDSISGTQVSSPPTTRRRKREAFTLPPIPSVVISVRRAPNEASSRSTTVASGSRGPRSNTLRAAPRVGPASRTLTSGSRDQPRFTTIEAASRTLSSAPSSVANTSPEPGVELAHKLTAIREEEEGEEEQQEGQEEEEDDDDEEEQEQEQEQEQEEMHHDEPIEVEDEVTQQDRDAGYETQEEFHRGDQHRHTRRYSEDERSLRDFSDNERHPEQHTEESHYQPELPEDGDDEDLLEERPKLSRLTRGNETAEQTLRKENVSTSKRHKRNDKAQVGAPIADRAKQPGKGTHKRPPVPRATAKPATTRKKQSPANPPDTNDGEVTSGENSDEDDEEDDEDYKPGPLPDWAQKRAEECYEAYYNEMLKIAHDAKKSPQSVFTHVNDIVPVTVQARNPWNAYLSWYNREGPNEKPDEWTTQQWTTFISEEYDKEVEARLPDAEDRGDPHQVREAMMEFIEWAEDRLTAYLEEAKSDPRKSSRLLHKTSTPFMQMAQRVYKEQGVHVFGFALPTREGNTSMGQGILWGGTPEFAAVKSRLRSQVSRTLEDLTAAFHMLQMEKSENAALVAHLYLQLPAKDRETPKSRLKRLIRLFVSDDTKQLCGTEVHLPSIVKKAFKYKLVLRNWPHEDIAIPGFNCDLSELNTQALRSIAQPRINYIKKTADNTLEADNLCHQHVRVELWDEEDRNLSFMSQRNVAVVTDINGKTLIKAEDSESWRAELLSLDEDEVIAQEEAGAKKTTVTARGGKGKGKEKATKPAKVVPVPKSMPLWLDDQGDNDDDDEGNLTPPPPQSKEAAPIHRVQPIATTKVYPRPRAEPQQPRQLPSSNLPGPRARAQPQAPLRDPPSLPPQTRPQPQAPPRHLPSSSPPPRAPVRPTVMRECSLPPVGPRLQIHSTTRELSVAPPPASRPLIRHPVAPTFRSIADVHDDYLRLPRPHNTHVTLAQEFAEYEEAQRARSARVARELERYEAACTKFNCNMEEYNARGWVYDETDETDETEERPNKKRKLSVDEPQERREIKPLPRGRAPMTLPLAAPSRQPAAQPIAGPSRINQPRAPPQPGPNARYAPANSQADRTRAGPSRPLPATPVPQLDLRTLLGPKKRKYVE
ncbi:hypothetical protein V5O48_016335 [Marasmius crinis-equi]|uniref:Uncharacterized protein n=1 Tax=Marasmius crinis-equi TaxID=585013 RepID=A0ABR3ES18_9AGAR